MLQIGRDLLPHHPLFFLSLLSDIFNDMCYDTLTAVLGLHVGQTSLEKP